MKFKSAFILPIIAVIMLTITIKRFIFIPDEPKASNTNDFAVIVSLGIVEPCSEVISISPAIPGLLKEIPVQAGQQVKKGQLLCNLDATVLKEQIESAKISLKQAKYNLSFYQKAQSAISKQELVNQTFGTKLASSKLKELEANWKLSHVLAPIDGTILKINNHVGEYAQPSMPVMVIGDISQMHVRVEIDETLLRKLKSQKNIYGKLRLDDRKIELKFARHELVLKNKRILTGDAIEQTDTRVLEVIYVFDNEKIGAISGQQMDVFINLGQDK